MKKNRLALLLALVCFAATTVAQSEEAVSAISVKERLVFDGHKGWPHEGSVYRLACGAALFEAPNGDLLCWWLSGSNWEPATDNNVLLSRSTDRGKTWSEPTVLIRTDPQKGAGNLSSMHATDDGRIIAFGANWPSDKHYTVWHYFRMESADNGHTWSKRVPIKIRPEENIGFGKPIVLSSGEYLFTTSFFEKRPIPLRGKIENLIRAKTESEAVAISRSFHGNEKENQAHKFGTHLHGCSVLIASDQEANWLEEHGAIKNRPLGLLESTVARLDGSRLAMLMRAEWGGFLWRSDSADNGRTWSAAYQTDIPNPTSLPALINLPDGRIALIHNATGDFGKWRNRDPLSIWVSDDGMKTWYLKSDVITGGQLAYPNPMVLEGRLVFVYDHDRRQVRFVEVNLPPARAKK